ncbi:MAG: hypothetical protein J7M21_04805, partial [Planctomycetes bacterium]|nr:hypothetical protein [Planctomycetota bacterium]
PRQSSRPQRAHRQNRRQLRNASGGELIEVPKHSVAGEAPPLAFRNCRRFWRCARCGRLLWRGTHWRKIARRLEGIAARGGEP